MTRLARFVTLLLLVAVCSACAAGRAFRRGEERARIADWDTAVAYFRQAVQAEPARPEYRIALERAMLNASRAHYDSARKFEDAGQLDAAVLEYRRTTEFDPSNRQAMEKVVQLERTIRDRIEASRPKPQIETLREQARQAAAEPILNPASREPIDVRFTNAGVRDILNFISSATGINITYDAAFQDRPYTVNLSAVTLEQALNQILTANSLFYKVLDQRTIIVVPESPQNRLRYEEQVIRTFVLSHADAVEMQALLNGVARVATTPVPPIIVANKTANSVTVRATAAVAGVIEEIIFRNDKPRAEVVIDVEILEVNRTRAKQFGLNLSQYQIGSIFSPEVAPPGAPGAPGGATTGSTFNLNTISQGVSTADFYMTVPSAVVRFLETDSQTKILAKPQLRGAEGARMTLSLGTDVPYLTTTFSPIAGGGANVNPLSSYQYRTVGINLDITTRVTAENDIVLDVIVESSTQGEDRPVGGTTAPSFGTRRVVTRLRLRDGESNLLAGLLREDERRNLRGLPGAINVPVLRQLLSDNDNAITQTDIVMLLTPRIVRTHELTARDLSPIYVGTNQNFGLGGPPPLIGVPPPEPDVPEPAAPPPAAEPGAAVPTVPQGSPVPGTVTTPTPPGAATTQTPTTAVPSPSPVPPAQPPGPTTLSKPQALSPPLAAAASGAQISLAAPAGDVLVAGGPYLVPVYINGASRISTVTLTITFNPSALRVRMIQEGSFLRQGNAAVTFTQQVDAAIGRIDLTMVRTSDTVGASGAGLLAAIVFDAIGPGNSTFTLSGMATDPGGARPDIQFLPASVVVR